MNLNAAHLNENTVNLIQKLNNDYTYFSVDSVKKELGFHNPVFTERIHLDSRESGDSIDAHYNRNRNFSIRKIDFHCFNRSFAVKTKTYSNYKKCMNMLFPYLVLICMIFVLIFVFRINIVLGTGNSIKD